MVYPQTPLRGGSPPNGKRPVVSVLEPHEVVMAGIMAPGQPKKVEAGRWA